MSVDHKRAIIEANDVRFSYGNEEVLSHVSFQVHAGDYIGIIGRNGAGKSTLIKIILGLLKPQGGLIELWGQDIRNFKEWHKCAYVSQKATHFDTQFPVTVFEVALMGTTPRRGMFKFHNVADREKALKALDQVGMLKFKDRLMGELSGGQQQKVFIARALAGEPEVMVLDEPTNGIDYKSQQELIALLRSLNEKGMTLLLVSHDIEMITREVMHVLCVDHTLTCHLTPEEFLRESVANDVLGRELPVLKPHHHDHA